jgi:Tfp pilus assembly protein PilF
MQHLRTAAVVAVLLAAALTSNAQSSAPDQSLDREFQSAVALYDAGHFAEAAAKLEKLLPSVPESFEAHELLGLVYSAQSQDARANEHLEKAVRLNPKSAEARTNLAANLVRLGKTDPAEEQFRKAAQLEPENFDANHNLGEVYVRS